MMVKMRVLIACECSGIIRDAFIRRGHDAISVDLKPTERPGPHHQGDVERFLASGLNARNYDLMIAHPPCTYLARVSAPEFAKDPGRAEKMKEARRFVQFLWMLDIPRICIENPIPMTRAGLGKPTQSIDPYWFGQAYLKKTCLWLKGLPPLVPTDVRREAKTPNTGELRKSKDGTTYFRASNGQPQRASNPYSWVDSNENKFDATNRSRTFEGIAEAMAEQWGSLDKPYGFF